MACRQSSSVRVRRCPIRAVLAGTFARYLVSTRPSLWGVGVPGRPELGQSLPSGWFDHGAYVGVTELAEPGLAPEDTATGPEGIGAYVHLPNFLIVAARRAA